MNARLDGHRVDAYLARLGAPDVSLGRQGLEALHWAHLKHVPFHNLLLLTQVGEADLPDLHQAVDDAIAGVGGYSHRTAPPFAALLNTIGFDARLAAATARAPRDHVVCIAETEGRRFLCDVGSGEPCLRPWSLDGPVQEQSCHGWTLRFDPRALGGPTLQRVQADGRVDCVYVVDPAPITYNDVAPVERAHRARTAGEAVETLIRATRVQPDAVLSLVGSEYVRATRFGRSRRRVAGRDALLALLVERFGLCEVRVRRALEVAVRCRPDLVEEPRWFALGRGVIARDEVVQPPARAAVPDVLVCVATVGREASMLRLLESLSHEVEDSRYPGRVGVLIVENHEARVARPPDGLPGIVVHRVPIEDLRPALERAARLGVLPALGADVPVPIGAAREAQLAAIRAHLDVPVAGLPHPADHPVVVWMVDDDMRFQQLHAPNGVGRHTHLLYRAARYWSEMPSASVVLGGFTGDPPVPGLDCLGGQLRDLIANTNWLLELGPHGSWTPLPEPTAAFDAYYDLTESSDAETAAVWPYASERDGHPTREVALALLDDVSRLLDGQQVTRPLTWDGRESPATKSLRRGGNALFLDIDAVFRWPTPVQRSSDGVMTRRADTLWAVLAQADGDGAVVEATLPLRHVREGQSPRPAEFSAALTMAGAHTAAQVRGVVMARALAEGRPVAQELAAREARVTSHRHGLRVALADLQQLLERLVAWRDPELEIALRRGVRVLEQLDRLAAAAVPIPGDARELQAFVQSLPQAVQDWRGAW